VRASRSTPSESVRARARRVRDGARLVRDAFVALTQARALVRGASTEALTRVLTNAAASSPPGTLSALHDQEIADVARAVRTLGRVFGRRRCLIEALATHHLLRARDLPCTLRFSVSRDRGALKAHAWVEVNDRVVIGDGPGFHTPLERTPTTRTEASPA
jgi:hypothetical protein